MNHIGRLAVLSALLLSCGCRWVCEGTCIAPDGSQSPSGPFQVEAWTQIEAELEATEMDNICPGEGADIVNTTCKQYGTNP